MLGIGVRNSTKIQIHTLVRRWIFYGDNGGANLVDGGGDQRREVAGDEEDDSETQRGRAGYARAKGFGKVSKFWPGDIYSLTLSV